MNLQVSSVSGQSLSWRDDKLAPLVRSKQRLRLKLYAAVVAGDLVAVAGGIAIGEALRFGTPFAPEGLTLYAALLPLFIGLALNSHAYSAHMISDWRRGLAAALLSLVAAAAAVLFLSFALKASAMLSRVAVIASISAAAVLLVLIRLAAARALRAALRGGPLARVLIRDGVDCACPADVRAFDALGLGLRPDIGDPLMLDRLGQLLRGADSIVVACPPERRSAWAMTLKGMDLEGELVMPEIAALGGIGTARFGAEATVVVSSGVLGLRARMIKRLLDLTLAVVALVALGPLMLFTAIAIRLDSRGPLLFVQPRLGRGNRLFAMYKFRSMHAGRCDTMGNASTLRDDDRITRVGRFIRATSIDELPQLLNILSGEMSFVGPRPHALGSLAGDALFWEVDHRYWHRHASKPGLTGLAQVRGFRGATHQRSDLVNRLQADLEYQNSWTIWRDLSILMSTIKVVVHRNAY